MRSRLQLAKLRVLRRKDILEPLLHLQAVQEEIAVAPHSLGSRREVGIAVAQEAFQRGHSAEFGVHRAKSVVSHVDRRYGHESQQLPREGGELVVTGDDLLQQHAFADFGG